MHQRGLHQVLAQEPGLQFVGAQHLAYNHVVCSDVSESCRTLSQLSAVANDDLVSVEQARKQDGDFLATARRAFDLGGLGDVMRHRNGKPSQQLDALGDIIHNLDLLAEMLVEQKVELIERGGRNLPVRLLVQVTQGYGIGEQLVEL